MYNVFNCNPNELLTPLMASVIFLRGISPPEIGLQICIGASSFIVLHFVCLGLIIIFPDLALWLPEILFERLSGARLISFLGAC